MDFEGEWLAAAPLPVPVDAIDAEELRFRITTRSDLEPLAASIGRLGLLQPLLLRAAGRGYTIVSGFRRLAACRQLGRREIPARVLSLGRLPVEDAGALGLPAHAGVAARLMRLERLPAAVREGVQEGAIALAMAEELGRLAPDAASAFARLFRRLGLGLNRQREILSLVTEIAAREGRPVLEILTGHELEECLLDPAADRGHAAQQIRRRLHRRRFPAIRRAEESFETLRRRLDLGEGLQLTPPRDFEGTCFSLTLSFGSLEELLELRGRLDALARNPALSRILESKAEGFAPAPPPAGPRPPS